MVYDTLLIAAHHASHLLRTSWAFRGYYVYDSTYHSRHTHTAVNRSVRKSKDRFITDVNEKRLLIFRHFWYGINNQGRASSTRTQRARNRNLCIQPSTHPPLPRSPLARVNDTDDGVCPPPPEVEHQGRQQPSYQRQRKEFVEQNG